LELLRHFLGIDAGAQGLTDFLRAGFGFFRRQPRSSFLRPLRFDANDDLVDPNLLEIALVGSKILANFFGCYYSLSRYFLVGCGRQKLTATHSEHLLESRSGVEMMLESILGENEHQCVLISKRPATLGSQILLSLGRERLDKPINFPLSYRLVSDLQDYLIG
jgi:hypothetical protein